MSHRGQSGQCRGLCLRVGPPPAPPAAVGPSPAARSAEPGLVPCQSPMSGGDCKARLPVRGSWGAGCRGTLFSGSWHARVLLPLSWWLPSGTDGCRAVGLVLCLVPQAGPPTGASSAPTALWGGSEGWAAPPCGQNPCGLRLGRVGVTCMLACCLVSAPVSWGCSHDGDPGGVGATVPGFVPARASVRGRPFRGAAPSSRTAE